MVPEKPNRQVPLRIAKEDHDIEAEGLVALYIGKFPMAEGLFRKQLELRTGQQQVQEHAVQKGKPLYNLALSCLAQKKMEDGVQNMLFTYVEDTLDTGFDDEDDADRAYAAMFLRDSLRIKLRILRDLKGASRKAKAEGLWDRVDPQFLLGEVAAATHLDSKNLVQYCEVKALALDKMPLGFPQPQERRVFIGTNYDTFAHVILPIKEAVVRRGYTPIVVNEAIFDPSETHDVSLLLLHTCKYAIFDVTAPAGQMMEIERARDYGLHVRLVRSAPVGHSPSISQMLKSLGYQVETYSDLTTDFDRIVRNFLP